MPNPNISRLQTIAGKQTCRAIGLMSGTSMDGLDIALCDIIGSGHDTKVELIEFTTQPYTLSQKEKIREIFSVPKVDLEHLCVYNAWLGNLHGEMILQALSDWNSTPDTIDFIASHGQTVYHAPVSKHGMNSMPNATLQISDGDHIAMKTGILTISDFRQKHTAAGGEGAPLAGYVDELLFFERGKKRVLLNIGGIGNITWLDGTKENQPVLITDTGPGNTLIDARVHLFYPDLHYDEDGMIAQQGGVSEELLSILKRDSFFKLPLPKSTGPEYFDRDFFEKALKETGADISPEDQIATLTRLTVECIADVIREVSDEEPFELYVSGGGCHNPVIMQGLREQLAFAQIYPFEDLGMNPDAKEAIIFAVLGNETLRGNGIRFSNNRYLSLGKISFPD